VLNENLEDTTPQRLAKDAGAADELDAVLDTARSGSPHHQRAPAHPGLARRARQRMTQDPRLPPLEPLANRLEFDEEAQD